MAGPTLEELAEVTRMARDAAGLMREVARRLAQWGMDALDEDDEGGDAGG